jgi:carboxymethylenebutenolidase
MKENTRTIPTADGPMQAYVAAPDGARRLPALLVMQEAYGVNDHIRDVCRRFAGEGWVAMSPELFHRAGSGLVFAYGIPPGSPDGAKISAVLGGLRTEGIASDIAASLADLRSLPEVDADRTGIVGFCMGGYASFLAACRTDVKTAVCFYPGGLIRERPNFGIGPILGEAEGIRNPILLVFGSSDTGIPLADVEIVRKRLVDLGKEHEIAIYEGAQHGFFCDQRASYDERSAKAAWPAVLEWLRRHV